MTLPVSESFLFSMATLCFGFLGGVLSCLLKSRCKKIKCCGCECDREVIALSGSQANFRLPQNSVQVVSPGQV